MRCTVLNCKSSNISRASKCGFFGFPKDETLLKKWLSFCQRSCDINTKNARICGLHFVSEDFENIWIYKMGFTKKRKLKAGAVPTIFNPRNKFLNLRQKHIERQTNKEIVEALLKDYEDSIDSIPSPMESTNCIEMDDESEAECLVESVIETDPLESEDSIPSHDDNISLDINYDDNTLDWEIEYLEDNNDDLRPEIRSPRVDQKNYLLKLKIAKKKFSEKLAAEKQRHSQAEKRFLNRIQTLSERLKKAEHEIKNIDGKLSAILSQSQLKQLKSGESKTGIWNEEDIAQSTSLYTSSAKVYMLLLQKGFPLPSVCTIQNCIQQKNMLKDSPKPIIK